MMYAFGNEFWTFPQGSPAVQALLEKSNLTLEELLNEESLATELKANNQKLFDFLLIEDNFTQMIDYVIHIPAQPAMLRETNKSHRYPHVCTEILSGNHQHIVDGFFQATSIENDTREVFGNLDRLLGFLDQEELNYTVAGYFAKIINSLYGKRPSILISYIFKTEILEKMVNHLASKSIAELLTKLITFEASLFEKNSNINLLCVELKSHTLSKAMEKLDPKNDIETIHNAAHLICETFGKYRVMSHGDTILRNQIQESKIKYLFEVLNLKDSNSSCAVALVLGNIFAYFILTSSGNTDINISIDENEDESSPKEAGKNQFFPLVRSFIDNIPVITSYLAESQGPSITNQYGANIVPFGVAKLKLIELLTIALKSLNRDIQVKLAQSSFIETLLELFLRFEFNNMLHNHVEKVIAYILEENCCHELMAALFEKADILNFLINASNNSEYTMAGKQQTKIRKGYMAQIVRLSNMIADSRDQYIMEQTAKNSLWGEYVEGELTQTNYKNRIQLGGKDPREIGNDFDYENEFEYSPKTPIAEGRNSEEEHNDFNDFGGDDENKENEEYLDDEEPENEEEEEESKKDFYSRLSQTGIRILQKSTDDSDEEIEDEEEIHEEEKDNLLLKSKYETEQPKQVLEELLREEKSSENEKEEFYTNVYFKKETWHTPDDVLGELGLL